MYEIKQTNVEQTWRMKCECWLKHWYKKEDENRWYMCMACEGKIYQCWFAAFHFSMCQQTTPVGPTRGNIWIILCTWGMSKEP